LLCDGLTYRDRIALETYRDARFSSRLSRSSCSAVEDCAPPGSVTREDFLTAEFTLQVEALVRGIYAIAPERLAVRSIASTTFSGTR
jgi:hypothetical protein